MIYWAKNYSFLFFVYIGCVRGMLKPCIQVHLIINIIYIYKLLRVYKTLKTTIKSIDHNDSPTTIIHKNYNEIVVHTFELELSFNKPHSIFNKQSLYQNVCNDVFSQC